MGTYDDGVRIGKWTEEFRASNFYRLQKTPLYLILGITI